MYGGVGLSRRVASVHCVALRACVGFLRCVVALLRALGPCVAWLRCVVTCRCVLCKRRGCPYRIDERKSPVHRSILLHRCFLSLVVLCHYLSHYYLLL